MDLKAIRERCESRIFPTRDGPVTSLDVLTQVELCDEIEQLRQELGDWNDERGRVLNEDCPPDEAHCTCVPHLRRKIEWLWGALAYKDGEIAAQDDIIDEKTKLLADLHGLTCDADLWSDLVRQRNEARAEIERLREQNTAHVQAWRSVCDAAGVPRDTMTTALAGRISALRGEGE